MIEWLMSLFTWISMKRKGSEGGVTTQGFGEFGNNGSVHVFTNVRKKE